MTPKEVLIAAKALIDTPEKWCQYQMEDYETGAHCALGAVFAVGGDREAVRIMHEAIPYRFVARALNYGLYENREKNWIRYKQITEYNDCRTHRGVMRWFDRAIKVAGDS